MFFYCRVDVKDDGDELRIVEEDDCDDIDSIAEEKSKEDGHKMEVSWHFVYSFLENFYI